jgi:hypothetical protein
MEDGFTICLRIVDLAGDGKNLRQPQNTTGNNPDFGTLAVDAGAFFNDARTLGGRMTMEGQTEEDERQQKSDDRQMGALLSAGEHASLISEGLRQVNPWFMTEVRGRFPCPCDRVWRLPLKPVVSFSPIGRQRSRRPPGKPPDRMRV